MVDRVSTGIAGLDALVDGGLPKGRIVLISGTPGTGKSIFCAQMAYSNSLKGKKCLYLNLEQNEGRLESQMSQFGLDLKKVEKNMKIVAVDSSDPFLVDSVLKEIQKLDYDVIVLDSLDSISSSPISPDEIDKMSLEKIADNVVPMVLDVPNIGRLKLKKIFTAIAKSKATALLTSERVDNAPGLSRDTISEFLSDGIVALKMSSLGEGVNRTIEVVKMRETKMDGSVHSFNFTKNGIVVE